VSADELTLFADRLAAGYWHRPVARLSHLELRAGESALLLGPSGSGKTTLLLAIAGLAQVICGRVEVKGQTLQYGRGVPADRVRGRLVGFVFQNIHLIAGLSVLDNVLVAAYAVGAQQDRQRGMRLLEAMGLGDLANRRAETLSRGQAQRVAIARSMLLQPALILADEPTASLDNASCETVATLLLTAARETGAALLIATHDARLRQRFGKEVMAEPVEHPSAGSGVASASGEAGYASCPAEAGGSAAPSEVPPPRGSRL
jgi:putative ABC transport system ATP-binding protein